MRLVHVTCIVLQYKGLGVVLVISYIHLVVVRPCTSICRRVSFQVVFNDVRRALTHLWNAAYGGSESLGGVWDEHDLT
jgi:hypothetical protein